MTKCEKNQGGMERRTGGMQHIHDESRSQAKSHSQSCHWSLQDLQDKATCMSDAFHITLSSGKSWVMAGKVAEHVTGQTMSQAHCWRHWTYASRVWLLVIESSFGRGIKWWLAGSSYLKGCPVWQQREVQKFVNEGRKLQRWFALLQAD